MKEVRLPGKLKQSTLRIVTSNETSARQILKEIIGDIVEEVEQKEIEENVKAANKWMMNMTREDENENLETSAAASSTMSQDEKENKNPSKGWLIEKIYLPDGWLNNNKSSAAALKIHDRTRLVSDLPPPPPRPTPPIRGAEKNKQEFYKLMDNAYYGITALNYGQSCKQQHPACRLE